MLIMAEFGSYWAALDSFTMAEWLLQLLYSSR